MQKLDKLIELAASKKDIQKTVLIGCFSGLQGFDIYNADWSKNLIDKSNSFADQLEIDRDQFWEEVMEYGDGKQLKLFEKS